MATTDTDPRYAREEIDRRNSNTTAWGWALAIIAVLLIAGAAYYYFHYTAAGTNPYLGASDTGPNGAAVMTTTPAPAGVNTMDNGATGTAGAPLTTTPAPATTTPSSDQ